jgi:hypothetical protein
MSERFEFRVFAPARHYRSLAQRFEGLLDPAGDGRSEEIYLFAPDAAPPRTGIKVKSGGLSLKRLIRHAGDLELWRPESVPFPLDRTRGVRIARACSLPPVPGGGWAVAPHLLRDAEKAPGICLAHVRKVRRRFIRGGLLGEAVRLEINGAELASLAVEAEDAEAVVALRAELRLEGRENVSYPRMLQYLAGFAPLPPGAAARVDV